MCGFVVENEISLARCAVCQLANVGTVVYGCIDKCLSENKSLNLATIKGGLLDQCLLQIPVCVSVTVTVLEISWTPPCFIPGSFACSPTLPAVRLLATF